MAKAGLLERPIWPADSVGPGASGPADPRAPGHFPSFLETVMLKVPEMATPAGLEPATCRLEGGCSIQLSYGAGVLPSGRRDSPQAGVQVALNASIGRCGLGLKLSE